MDRFIINEKGQATPAQVYPVTAEAFGKINGTQIRWLGGGNVLINSRGTIMLIDPLLTGFDMPLLLQTPLQAKDVPQLDALLVTHVDNDHFSRETCLALKDVCRSYHSTQYVAEEMRSAGICGTGHDIGEQFSVGCVDVKLTPALHNWQAHVPGFEYRQWKEEDYCGFWLDTPDGTIWLPADSQLMECHLNMPQPDVILFDFSDNVWHITLDGAVRLANAYPDAKLLCIHWGTVDAPDMSPFNANPADLMTRVVNPERICALCPGEALEMNKE